MESYFIQMIYLLIALAVCITIHEAAHAWAAYKLGDPTAKIQGRVTLNPLMHLDPLGTIMVFVAGFGWGKPVPFNYHNLKYPRRDTALIAIAGPMSNLATAFVIALIMTYIKMPIEIANLLYGILSLSIVLFLFNLIPIAPLDGSKLIGLIVPDSQEFWYQDFLSKGPLFLILLIIADRVITNISGFSFFGFYISYGFDLIKSWIFLTS